MIEDKNRDSAESIPEQNEPKRAYQAPKVESVRLSKEAAEALT